MGNGTGVNRRPFQIVSGLSLQKQDEAIAQIESRAPHHFLNLPAAPRPMNHISRLAAIISRLNGDDRQEEL